MNQLKNKLDKNFQDIYYINIYIYIYNNINERVIRSK